MHVCWYENKPSEEDLRHLGHELMTDEEFGLVGEKDLTYVMFTREEYDKLEFTRVK